MVKCLKQTRKSPGNIEGDRQDGSRYDRQICQDFRHTGNLLDLFLQNAEVEGKVDTKQDHKRSDDALLQHRIACTPITFYRKSTGTGRTECNAEGIKQRHFADQQQNDLNQRHTKINSIKNCCRIADLRHEFAHVRSRTFCFHQVYDCSISFIWNKSKDKDQNSHTSYPVGKTSPEQTGT